VNILNSSSIKFVFKGDQNLFWDGMITDFALKAFLRKQEPLLEFIPFIHDEKFGAPDQNLTHCLEQPNGEYFISEDYADSAGDACYINLDTSFGIFYFPVVEVAKLRTYSINVRSLAKQYTKELDSLDQEFVFRCSEYGLHLDYRCSKMQGLGTIPNQDEMDCFFEIHPEQRIFYLFSRALGRYGIAPIKDENHLSSSVYTQDSNIEKSVQYLMEHYLMQGILDQSDPGEHPVIQERFNLCLSSLKEAVQENSSLADFELKVAERIQCFLFEENRMKVTKSSKIFASLSYGIKNWYLQEFMNNPDRMIDVYNESLNETKMSIQRLRKNEALISIPFYVNCKDVTGRMKRFSLFWNSRHQKLMFKNSMGWEEFIAEKTEGFITGKAIPFLNELRLEHNAIALPEQGSKYTPACDAFIKNLRQNGLNIPEAHIIRVAVNFLDNLVLMGDRKLILPFILIPYFAKEISCKEFSQNWRKVVKEIETILQYVRDFVPDGKEYFFASHLSLQGRFMHPEMKVFLQELVEQYKEILSRRAKQVKNGALQKEYKSVQFKIKILVKYYIQQLVQVHEGLLYLNDRPYSLAIFLMFGPEFMQSLINNVTFRVETV